MPKITCKDGAQLFLNITGQGIPLILIAGGFCDHHVWDDVINLLSDKFQVITYDNRGIGKSDVTQSDYTVKLLASDLNYLLTQLNISSAHIVGHSMGGFVAQYFAAYYPEKVLSLGLLSSLLVMNSIGYDYLNTMIDRLNQNPEATRQSMSEQAGRAQSIHSILQQIKLCKNHDARGYIDRITSPTLIISGRKELIVTEIESKKLASEIKNVKDIILVDCDHMLQREAPKELANILLKYLVSQTY